MLQKNAKELELSNYYRDFFIGTKEISQKGN